MGYLTGVTSGQITTALGYTPYSSSNPNNYISNLGSFSTANLAEGSNLYYTDARVKAYADQSYRPIGYVPAWGDITSKPAWTEKLSWDGSYVVASSDLHVTGKLVVDGTIQFFGAGAGGTGGGGSTTLWGLADVDDDVANAVSGDLIVYNGTHFVRINQSALSPSVHTHTIGQVTGLQDYIKRQDYYTASAGIGNGFVFPNDAYGGGDDTAGLRLVSKGGEAMTLELYTTNDADDTVNFSTYNATVNGVSIVLDTDARLTNARVASDVYGWAKAATKPSYGWGEIDSRPTALSQFSNDLGNYGNFATHRGEGTNYIDGAYSMYDAYIGGWRTSNDLRVLYAQSAGSAPASDVYGWAKAATKPSYTKSEIGLGNVDNTADISKKVDGAIKLWSASHPNDYYITNAWDGTYWQLKANHDSPVNVGHADNASNAGLLNGRSDYILDGDARLTNARVASDVYGWAKAATKPSYGWGEIDSRPTALSQFSNDLGNYGNFATRRPEGTNFIDYAWSVYDAYVGGWRTSNDLRVLYAQSAGSAPASDVYGWAKAATKPSYNYSEIGNTPALNFLLLTGGSLSGALSGTSANFSGNITAGGTMQFYTASDRRLKQDFEAITNPIEKIKALTGYFFNYNNEGMRLGGYANRRDIGLIAQDVNAILPEATGTLWGTEYMGYKADKLIPLLVEAIKAQQTEIDQLKKQVA